MVAILLGKGFEEAEALVPADLLRRADIPVQLVGVDGVSVAGSHGITVTADCTLDQVVPQQLELLFLPGGTGGVRSIQNSAPALELVRKAHAAGVKLAAICAGPTILASLGLLEGKKAVCYPGLEERMAGAVMQPDAQVVVDGDIITGQAAGAAFPFGLALVEALRGAQKAQEVKNAVYFRG